MKHIKTFESEESNEGSGIFGGGTKNSPSAKEFKYIEATPGDSQTDRLIVASHKKYTYIKQGGPGGNQVYVDKAQAEQLIELLKKYLDIK